MDPHQKRLNMLYRTTLERMAEEAKRHVGASFGDALENVLEEYKKLEGELEENRKYEMLEGKGPLGNIRRRLGFKQRPVKNLLTQVPEDQQLNKAYATGLAREFLSTELTALNEGGLFNYQPTKCLPHQLEDLEVGVYWASEHKQFTAVVMEVHEDNHGFLVISFPPGEDPHVVCVNHVESEGETIAHFNYHVFSRRGARKAMTSMISSLGGKIPLGVSVSDMLEKVKKDPDKHYSVQGFELMTSTPDRLTVSLPGDEILDWDHLSLTKQEQFYQLTQ